MKMKTVTKRNERAKQERLGDGKQSELPPARELHNKQVLMRKKGDGVEARKNSNAKTFALV